MIQILATRAQMKELDRTELIRHVIPDQPARSEEEGPRREPL